MRRSFRPRHLCVIAAAALPFALGACGSDTVTSTTGGPTPDQIAAIGNAVETEMESAVGLMTVKNVETPFTASARVVATAPGVRALAVPWNATTNCPTLSPDPAPDSDGDGVPDSVEVTFTPGIGQCTTQDQSGIYTVSGHVEITDPAPTTAGLTLNATAGSFMLAASTIDGNASITDTRNGSWSVTASDSGVTEAWNVDSRIQITGRADLSISSQWTGNFVPLAGDTINLGRALPPGDFWAAGSMQVGDGTNSYDVTLTTPTGLAYNPVQCSGTPTSFSNGEVHAATTLSGKSGYVVVSWADCQSPTFAFIPQ